MICFPVWPVVFVGGMVFMFCLFMVLAMIQPKKK
jgi:hypothetical protein